MQEIVNLEVATVGILDQMQKVIIIIVQGNRQAKTKKSVPSGAMCSHLSMRPSHVDSLDRCIVKNAAVPLLAQNKKLDLKGLKDWDIS